MNFKIFSSTLITLLLFSTMSNAKSLTIDNQFLTVHFTQEIGEMDVVSKENGETFLSNARFYDITQSSEIVTIKDKVFGNGKAIKITCTNGNVSWVMLYPKVRFALFKTSYVNNGLSPIDCPKYPIIKANVILRADPDSLRVLGTAGLTGLNDQGGSYMYLAVVNPKTRNGIVSGWLTCDRGNGIISVSNNRLATNLEGFIDYGNNMLKSKGRVESETFAVGYFADARIGLESFADNLALEYKVELGPQPSGFCTFYTEKYGYASDEVHLKHLVDFSKQLIPYGFNFIQIDDYWQNGIKKGTDPRMDFSKARFDGPYPSGMKLMADSIKSAGLTAGLWLLPFGRDMENGDVKDFMLVHKKSDGTLFTPLWGGTPLDMTVEASRKHLQEIIDRIVNQWGYKYLKLDGIYDGFCTYNMYPMGEHKYTPNDGADDAKFSDPYVSNIENFKIGMKLIRQAAGKDIFMNACNAGNSYRIYGAAVGLFNSVRICEDGGMAIGAKNGTQKYFLHGRAYYCDPDILYVRNSFELDQAQLSASWAGITGQMTIDSDWMPDLDAERVNILKRVMPAHGLKPRPVDLFDTDKPATTWLLTDTTKSTRRDVIGLFNFDKQPINISFSLDKIGLDRNKTYVGFNFWKNQLIPEFSNQFSQGLLAQSTEVIAVRPISQTPQIISTSRHVSQGMMDIDQEKWNNKNKSLFVKCKVVEKDDYEVRIVNGASGSFWTPANVILSKTDQKNGVIATFVEDGILTRVKIKSDKSKEIEFHVEFKRK
jgi:hypothetical protein